MSLAATPCTAVRIEVYSNCRKFIICRKSWNRTYLQNVQICVCKKKCKTEAKNLNLGTAISESGISEMPILNAQADSELTPSSMDDLINNTDTMKIAMSHTINYIARLKQTYILKACLNFLIWQRDNFNKARAYSTIMCRMITIRNYSPVCTRSATICLSWDEFPESNYWITYRHYALHEMLPLSLARPWHYISLAFICSCAATYTTQRLNRLPNSQAIKADTENADCADKLITNSYKMPPRWQMRWSDNTLLTDAI